MKISVFIPYFLAFAFATSTGAADAQSLLRTGATSKETQDDVTMELKDRVVALSLHTQELVAGKKNGMVLTEDQVKGLATVSPAKVLICIFLFVVSNNLTWCHTDEFTGAPKHSNLASYQPPRCDWGQPRKEGKGRG